MATNKLQMANIQQYTESVNANGEISVSGQISGQAFSQTLFCEVPCVLFFDPSNATVHALHEMHEWRPGLLLMSFITSVTPD